MIGCTEEPAPIAVTSVTLDSTSMMLVEGENQKLTATISPSNAENKAVIWSSSNSSVASVKEGLVTAVKSGNATITVKSDDGGKTATCAVTVNAKVYPVEDISLDKTSQEMTEGDDFTLTATVKPDNATNKNVTWNSSDPSVATVDNGKVIAKKAGTATITVKTDDGGKTASCVVTVNAKVYPVESISLDKTSFEMTEGDDFTLTATVKPDNATNKNVTWNSSDPSVATVDNGKVIAKKAGTATITVKTDDGGKTATCKVTVNIVITNYIDEYGINHGPGIEIEDVVWAPVNCGYHKVDFKYGKLYQWGRKYGQGYNGDIYDFDGRSLGTYTDSCIPAIETGGVSITIGNNKSKENVYYIGDSDSMWDWVYPQDDTLWNSGTEEKPVKTEYDPCPTGWRVPTYKELNKLRSNNSSWTTNVDGQAGYWYCGSNSYTSEVPQVFFPAAGHIYYTNGKAQSRGKGGDYWSSKPGRSYGLRRAWFLHFYRDSYTDLYNNDRASGYSVRCVQE